MQSTLGIYYRDARPTTLDIVVTNEFYIINSLLYYAPIIIDLRNGKEPFITEKEWLQVVLPRKMVDKQEIKMRNHIGMGLISAE